MSSVLLLCIHFALYLPLNNWKDIMEFYFICDGLPQAWYCKVGLGLV